jgi:hypothetical protein
MAEIPWFSQFYIGRGVNSTTGIAFGVAIDFDTTEVTTSGQKVTFSLESISSSRELAQKVGVAATAAYVGTGWGVSGETNITTQRDINAYYTYALAKVSVTNPPRIIRKPKLKTEVQEFLVQRGWDEFAATYGFEYIEGYIDGGQYYALIEIQTRNEKQQTDIKSKLSAFYGTFKAEATVTTGLMDITKDTTTNVFVMQAGGSGDVIETTLGEMITQARNFPKVASEQPVPITALTNEYRKTILLPAIPDPNSLARTQQRNNLQDLGRSYLRLRDYKANLEFILTRFEEFDDFRELSKDELAVKRKEYEVNLQQAASEIDEIVKRGNACNENYSQCQTYTLNIQWLPLPKIGGQLMNMKQIEEKLHYLELQLSQFQRGDAVTRHITIRTTPDDGADPWSHMLTIQSSKHEPPYVSLMHDPNNHNIKRYGVIQAGVFDANNVFNVRAEDAILSLSSPDHIDLYAPYIEVHGEIRGKLSYSGGYTWEAGQEPVKMIHSSRGFPVIVRVSGKFEGGGEHVDAYVGDDGYWYLSGGSQAKQSNGAPGYVSVTAICVGMV